MGLQRGFLVCLLGVLLWAPASASAQQDVQGGKDHPLVGRFAGSRIALYDAKDFDEYVLPLGKMTPIGSPSVWTKSQKLEGKATRITYVAPQTAATLAIQRSYEAALKKAGFEVLFVGGDADFRDQYSSHYADWYRKANPYPIPQGDRAYFLGGRSQRYLAARLRRPEGDVYVAVFASTGNVMVSGSPTVQVDVIEVRPLEAGLVTAEAMAEGLERSGRVAIYTIYFDTGKAEIRPESEPTLKEIARLLQRQPGLGLYVVGHTDNVGTLPYNVDLSQRRAKAVGEALAGKHGVDAKRLQSAGVGPLAPVAPNITDEGRAKNRRVELVAQ